MSGFVNQFERHGYCVIEPLFDDELLKRISTNCSADIDAKVGSRNLLQLDWVKELARHLKLHSGLACLMPNQAKTIQCNYFAKNRDIELVSASHNHDHSEGFREVVPIKRGGALVMKPLLLHASTKVKHGERRVLHFVFGPSRLPDNAQWEWAI